MPHTDFTGYTEDQIIAVRQHPVLDVRYEQIYTNILALNGGKPYICARLSRFPAESAIDWEGRSEYLSEYTFSKSAGGLTGRKDRAYLVNHAYRISEKIRQFVFSVDPVREGLDQNIAQDITRDGGSVNKIMGRICHLTTAARWAWLGVDMPRMTDDEGNVVPITVAEADANKIRPYWKAYGADEVVDWCFDEIGRLKWLITERVEHPDRDARTVSYPCVVRRLWEPGTVREVHFEFEASTNADGGKPKILKAFDIPLDFDDVPFILSGEISDKPWWFDDVEGVQKAIMDLESANDTAYYKSVYPQMVLPQDVDDEATGQTGGSDLGGTVSTIIGGPYAVLENIETKGISRYIMPPDGALGRIQDELERKRQLLFETVGLQLRLQSRTAESAEAKRLDTLDSEAVLRDKSRMLEETERKAMQMSVAIDPSFPQYEPEYAQSFDVSDLESDMKTLVMANQMEMPDSARRITSKVAFEKIMKLSSMKMERDELAEVLQAFDEMKFSAPLELGGHDMNDEQEDEPIDGVE